MNKLIAITIFNPPVSAPVEPIKLSDCWAKTDLATGMPALSVRDHSRIVGYIASGLLQALAQPVKDALPNGAVTLAAAHDLGKVTPGFQLKCRLWPHHSAVNSAIFHDQLETRHAHVSAWHLAYADSSPLPPASREWLVSTAGHHGSYPSGFKKPSRKCFEGANTATGIHPAFEQLRTELLKQLIQEFGPLPEEPARDAEIRVHLLTGFTILADWIGSNVDWFPIDQGCDAGSIQKQSRSILSKLGYEVGLRKNLDFGEVFHPEDPVSFSPRPLQEVLLRIADHPGLYIVEAPMGSGKTESALAAAYRRWCEGSERGLYFALPTQLTSAKIHDRIQSFLHNILDEPAFQALVHGNAWLDDNRNRTVGPAGEESNDTDEALRWYSSTRRQLLAPFGTGTIDQALLAILPARFAALRYFALAGKVIVIDEVHSYDPYMSALIDRLVRYLLPTGATVVILSATLTAARRAGLVAAAGASEIHSPSAYPLITKVATGDAVAEHFTVADPTPPKSVSLIPVVLTAGTENGYWQSIADQVNSGANVVVIRNTVALAQETYRLIRSLLTGPVPPGHTGLLHSRFTHTHRLVQEGQWIEMLGKNPARRPTGALLVATQIVEQSVDIDADLLITDLAPVELILQRIGRLHRHNHKRPVGCEKPTCHILHPQADWQADAEAVEAALAPHHFIYPPLALWQASQTLKTRKSIELPTDIRPLLESAACATPDAEILRAFGKFLPESERLCSMQKGTAKIRHVFAQAIDDKEGRETRYRIQPTAHLVLLSRPLEILGENVTLHPVHGHPVSVRRGFFSHAFARALHANAISIPAHLVRDTLRASSVDWLRSHLSDAVLAIVRANSAELDLYPDVPCRYSFEHTNEIGLTWKKSAHHPAIITEPGDFWF